MTSDFVKRLTRGLKRLSFYWNWFVNPPSCLYVTFGEYWAIKDSIKDEIGCDFGIVDGELRFCMIPVVIGTDQQVTEQRQARTPTATEVIEKEFAGAS